MQGTYTRISNLQMSAHPPPVRQSSSLHVLTHQALNTHQSIVPHLAILMRHQFDQPCLPILVRNQCLGLVPTKSDELANIVCRHC